MPPLVQILATKPHRWVGYIEVPLDGPALQLWKDLASRVDTSSSLMRLCTAGCSPPGPPSLNGRISWFRYWSKRAFDRKALTRVTSAVTATVHGGTDADSKAVSSNPRRPLTRQLLGGDERTRTADPLLAKHGLGDSLTSGFASSAGHGHDSGEVEKRKVRP